MKTKLSLILIIAVLSIVIGKGITQFPPLVVIGVVLSLIIGFITLVNTNVALIILIFSMLLSPEIPIARVPERAVVIRIDDILLLVTFFTWLAKMALNKELGLLKKTPINRPLGIYVLLCIVVTAVAISLGIGQARLTTSFFYILKYIEYFILFYLVYNNLKSIKQCKMFSLFLLLTCVIVCIYGYSQIQRGAYRVSAPFEGEHLEPNTLAGYMIVIFGLIGGLFLHSTSPRLKTLLSALFLFIAPVFLFTLSRGGYIGFITMYLAFIIFAKKKRMFLIGLFLILLVALPPLLPIQVITRIKTTFIGQAKYDILGKRIALEGSAAARIETWKYILLDVFAKSPIFGYGVGGIYFVDTQYGRILGELGIIGIVAFLWLMYRLFKTTLSIYRENENEYVQGISSGFLTTILAVLVMCLGANIFIIVRIMEPFWFIAAIVLMVPQLISENSGTQ